MAVEKYAQDFLVEKRPEQAEYINGFFEFGGFGLLQTVIFHPFYYVTTLIQIGYEPLPPKHEVNLGEYHVYYPNKIAYVTYIAKTYGFTGLYRGLLAHLAYRTTRIIIIQSIRNTVYFRERQDCRYHNTLDKGESIPEVDKMVCHFRNTVSQLVAVSAGIAVSHPFYVIMVRRMGSVVGGEMEYNGIFSSVLAVYQSSGVSGFFTGLTHRLFSGAVGVIIPSICVYALSYMFDLTPIRMSLFARVAGHVIGHGFSAPISHRNRVCSTTMIVNNSGLAIGTVPYTPIFGSAFDCYSHLYLKNQLYRGNTFFRRPYTGPPITVAISSPLTQNQIQGWS